MTLRKKLLIYIEEVNLMHMFNWAKVIREVVFNNMETCSQRVRDRENGGRKASVYLNGCTTLLMIWVLEHTYLVHKKFPRSKLVYQKWCGRNKLWGKTLDGLDESEVNLHLMSYTLGRIEEKKEEKEEERIQKVIGEKGL